VTILGNPDELKARAGALGVDLESIELVDPVTSPLRGDFAKRYFELRKHRGVTEDAAFDMVIDPSYFGTLMVAAGKVDGMVSGAAHTTADTIRPAFEIIKAREAVSAVSSVVFMCTSDSVLAYGA